MDFEKFREREVYIHTQKKTLSKLSPKTVIMKPFSKAVFKLCEEVQYSFSFCFFITHENSKKTLQEKYIFVW